MVAPPSGNHSLEGGDQGFNGDDGQNGRFRTRFNGQVGARDGDVSDQAGENFDLTMANMSWESGDPRELVCSAEEGMSGILDSDVALAFLRDQRGITLGEFCRFHGFPRGSN